MASFKKGPEIKDVIRGDTRRVGLTFYEADGTTPLDLTGGTVSFTVNSNNNPSSNSSAAIHKTASSGFTDADNGRHVFELTHSDTNIAPAKYWYDAQFIDQAGGHTSAYRGEFIVQSDIDRD